MKKIWSVFLMIIILGIGFSGCSKNGSKEDLFSPDSTSKDVSSLDSSLKDDNSQDTTTGDVSSPDSNKGKVYQIFEADVIETGDRLLVSPDEDSLERTSSDKISVGLSQVKEIPDLKPGDRIKISYGGEILESYPAQISADKIELIGHDYVVDGFFALIDDIYNEDIGLNHDISMIAIDTRNLDMLSETEIEIILSMVKKEYNFEVIQGSFDELAEQGLIDKENLYFKDGILLEFNEVKISKDGKKITCSIKKWRSGKGAIGWDTKAKFDGDKWNITREKEWIS